MTAPNPSPVVHLELHTANLARAIDFYTRVAGWRMDRVEVGPRSYHALDWGTELGGGAVECGTSRPSWLPYVEVSNIDRVTERAGQLGATVLLGPNEGPAGWRSVVAVPEGAEIAFWQPKLTLPGPG